MSCGAALVFFFFFFFYYYSAHGLHWPCIHGMAGSTFLFPRLTRSGWRKHEIKDKTFAIFFSGLRERNCCEGQALRNCTQQLNLLSSSLSRIFQLFVARETITLD